MINKESNDSARDPGTKPPHFFFSQQYIRKENENSNTGTSTGTPKTKTSAAVLVKKKKKPSRRQSVLSAPPPLFQSPAPPELGVSFE